MKLKENITEILAILIITMSFIFLFIVIYKPIPSQNKDLVNLAVGFVLGGALSGVIGYYFGTSKNRDIIPEPGQSVTKVEKSITTEPNGKS